MQLTAGTLSSWMACRGRPARRRCLQYCRSSVPSSYGSAAGCRACCTAVSCTVRGPGQGLRPAGVRSLVPRKRFTGKADMRTRPMLLETCPAAVPRAVRTSGGANGTGSCWRHPHRRHVQRHPFKSPVWRLLGVRTGRRVFNDGCAIPERALVTIGDRCTLNAGLVICHSRPGQQARHRSARTCLAASSVTFPCWPEPAWPPRMQRMRRTDSTSWKPCGTLTRRSGTSAITSSSPAAGRSRPRRDRQTALSDAGRGRR